MVERAAEGLRVPFSFYLVCVLFYLNRNAVNASTLPGTCFIQQRPLAGAQGGSFSPRFSFYPELSADELSSALGIISSLV